MSAFEKKGKSSSLNQNSRRKRKLSDKDRQALMRIVWKDHKSTAPKMTAKFKDHLENPVSLKTVWRDFTWGYNSKKTFWNKFHQQWYVTLAVTLLWHYVGGPPSRRSLDLFWRETKKKGLDSRSPMRPEVGSSEV